MDGDLHSRSVVVLVIVVGNRRMNETQIGNKEIKRQGKEKRKGK